MKKDEEKIDRSELRRRAERQMKSTISDDEELSGMSTTDMQRTIHELRVHQIELKMQNDELRRIQQELEAAKDRYSNLYDFSPVGYLTVNEKGMIEVANLTFANLVGMDRSAVVGKPFSGFIQPEDQDVYYLHRRRLLDSGNFQSFRLKLAKNDGLDFYANVECMVIREIDSDLQQIRIVVSDITEQKALESRLWQAQKMEAIAKLAGGIAHQFNNGLFVIVGTLDMLEMQLPKHEKISKFIASIRKSAEQMEALTGQLLAYARGGKYEGKDISLSAFVRDTLPLLQHTLDPSIKIESHLPADILKTKGDTSQFLMILSAVLSNAAEAMEGNGRIRIACRNKLMTKEKAKVFPGLLLPGPYVILTIEDSGSGMDEKTIKRVFEPFYTTKLVGRGLGLAAVYGIVKNHGGWITVESKVGRGTTVSIYLPAISDVE
jgi:two-component system cell cycle sensor histidine kinase/response regulator CckA